MSENTKQLTFYLVREKSEDTTKDFSDFVYRLRDSYVFVDVVQDSPDTISISGHSSYKSQLRYLTFDKPDFLSDYSFCMCLTIGSEDYITFGKLRQFLTRQREDFRIYSHQLQCFLPKDIDLVSLEFGSVNIKAFDILKKYDLRPIYYSQQNHLYYALTTDKHVNIVNHSLLEYIFDKEIPESKLSELSYQVAPNLNFFSAMYDKKLIPVNFYEYFSHSTKIINRSFFDINHPNRKVFVKPYIFEFKEKSGEFYTYAGPDGASMLMMSKILQGETLETCLQRVLQDELKIATDFIGAFVSEEIEFDRDREGILTPRLVVFVYVDKILDKAKNLQLSQTGWRSTNGNLPKITQNPEFKNIGN